MCAAEGSRHSGCDRTRGSGESRPDRGLGVRSVLQRSGAGRTAVCTGFAEDQRTGAMLSAATHLRLLISNVGNAIYLENKARCN